MQSVFADARYEKLKRIYTVRTPRPGKLPKIFQLCTCQKNSDVIDYNEAASFYENATHDSEYSHYNKMLINNVVKDTYDGIQKGLTHVN